MMKILTVMDSGFNVVSIWDHYYSLVWAERYIEVGDFELELPISMLGDPGLENGFFITSPETFIVMIIGNIKVERDDEVGDKITVTGYCCKDTLRWRATSQPLSLLNADVRATFISLLADHFTVPTDTNRKFPNFIGRTSLMNADSTLDDLYYTGDFKPQEVYSIMKEMAEYYSLGIKVDFQASNPRLRANLYTGVDHSYEQTDNPFVVFSDDFDNLVTSLHFISKQDSKNVCMVDFGEDHYAANGYMWLGEPTAPSGYFRREGVTQGEFISTGPGTWSWSDGNLYLLDKREVGVFDGEVNIMSGSFNYGYGADFDLGDIVQCVINGINKRARVMEVVRSYTEEGPTIYASFRFNLD
jgi:hypothetical protein